MWHRFAWDAHSIQGFCLRLPASGFLRAHFWCHMSPHCHSHLHPWRAPWSRVVLRWKGPPWLWQPALPSLPGTAGPWTATASGLKPAKQAEMDASIKHVEVSLSAAASLRRLPEGSLRWFGLWSHLTEPSRWQVHIRLCFAPYRICMSFSYRQCHCTGSRRKI